MKNSKDRFYLVSNSGIKRNIAGRYIPCFITVLFLFISVLSFALMTEQELQEIGQVNLEYKRAVYDQILEFVGRNPNFRRNDEQYMKLAELSATLFPAEPEVSLNHYRKVIELNPHFPNRDIVLYNIAYHSTQKIFTNLAQRRLDYQMELLDSDEYRPIERWDEEYRITEQLLIEPIQAYQEIIDHHPNSEKFAEALFRLAALHYEIGHEADVPMEYYELANQLFNQLAETDDERFQHIGLYQRAWTHYSKVEYEKAIRDFSELLNIVDHQDVDMFRLFFEEDAINNIAYSLDRLDAVEGAYGPTSISVDFAKNQLPAMISNDAYLKRIFGRTAEVKLEANLPFQAVEYYQGYIDVFPLDVQNPLIVDSLATIYITYQNILPPDRDIQELISEQKIILVERYHVESNWFKENSDKDISKQIAVIQEAYHYLDYDYWNAFAETMNKEHLRAYEEFIDHYDSNPAFADTAKYEWVKEREYRIVTGYENIALRDDTPEANYKAWQQYIHYNSKYPEHDDWIEFEADRYYFFSKFYEQITQEEPVDTVITVAGTESEYTVDDLRELFLYENQAFIDTFTHEDYYDEENRQLIITALYDMSQIYLGKDEVEKAEKKLLEIINYDPDPSDRYAVYIELAQINDENRNFDLAEQYYRRAAEYAADESAREELVYLARRQVLERAEVFAADSSFVEAAENFLQFAQEYKETNLDRYIGFTIQAAEAYEKAGEFQKSIDLYLGLSDVMTDTDEQYYVFDRAWTVADSLMNNHDYATELKNRFIELNPSSNLAFELRVEFIEDLEDDPATKYQAAEKWIDLHNDAVDERIDIGDNRPENLLFFAVGLMSDSTAYGYDVDLFISKMLEFERLYPEDPRADDMLVQAWRLYDQRGMEEERNEIARYIFNKDPESTFYEDVAIAELEEINNHVIKLYEEEDYERMLEKIEEFRSVHNEYLDEGLDLSFDSTYERFERFTNYYEQLKYYDVYIAETRQKIDEFEEAFINRSPAELFRVVWQTEYDEHIVPRLNQLVTTVQNMQNELQELAVEIAEQDDIFFEEIGQSIPEEFFTRIDYIIGRTYEHAITVVETQLNRYLEVSREVQEVLEAAEEFPEAQEFYDNVMLPETQQDIQDYSNYFRQGSVAFYTQLWNINRESDYTDEYIQMAMDKLSKMGYLTEELNLYTNTDWLAVTSEELLDIIDSSMSLPVEIYSEYLPRDSIFGLEQSEAFPIWIDRTSVSPDTVSVDVTEADTLDTHGLEPAYFVRKIDIDGTVENAMLRFASHSKSSILINGTEVASGISLHYDDDYDETSAEVLPIDSSVFVQGENTIIIKAETNGDKPGVIFDLNLTVSK